MAPEWSPQRRITPELAADVIAAQFPELADQDVRAFDAGWDNAVLAVGERWLFRFVHREIAVDGSRRELAVLSRISELPLPIPRPRFVGRPTPEVPWPFWGAERLPGTELAASGLADRAEVAAALGGFLRELHDPARLAQVGAGALPVDPIGRADPARQALRAEQRLTSIARGADDTDVRDRADDLLVRSAPLRRAALRLAPGRGRVLVHGDLHGRHVLVEGSSPTGVIDWGDTAVSDPAVDLMVAWASFGPADRAVFWEAYGRDDAGRRLRARATALNVCSALAEQAAADGRVEIAAEAFAGAARACDD
ncbi:phosphotransferase [Isoptericola sp. b441]|uniref:Phosphotransferase n=1 Tax=Actinotalea lenta TaxID=3064654 RepID=A0ABT9D561_9CELL|nr:MULTISPECIES: phosphotransferase [unclassified Isoptericola]MDO8105871.1 phosphotransferase [Isoptericola sp. b441]MDO8122587.1 phosphotransferase [Isoptericola sp. b490]